MIGLTGPGRTLLSRGSEFLSFLQLITAGRTSTTCFQVEFSLWRDQITSYWLKQSKVDAHGSSDNHLNVKSWMLTQKTTPNHMNSVTTSLDWAVGNSSCAERWRSISGAGRPHILWSWSAPTKYWDKKEESSCCNLLPLLEHLPTCVYMCTNASTGTAAKLKCTLGQS